MEYWLLKLTEVYVYFIPTLMALFKKHNKFSAIFMVNLFLGWTVIGWVIALVWSFTNSQQSIMKYNNNEVEDNSAGINENIQVGNKRKSIGDLRLFLNMILIFVLIIFVWMLVLWFKPH